ncbi:hypothetical protein K461DRAFT_267706 [Myriangium duriaei CBS 260.36]|uniref:Pre-mRNA-processing protein prp40 n=1 Tax=Myriangium duriaei CBS 260.36 TaxID=1168546 RepID=A0A9P4MHD6_9PEZI|nr:hypothetical protein K461DRAFT_267706 [Myriangium duriaei CBS 260.36]
MNGASDSSGWAETTDQKSGRPYYYNTRSNQTSWTKPDELLTQSQRATGWTQTSTAEGRLYWFNKSNKAETAWTAPNGWDEPAVDSSQFVSSSFSFQQRDQGSRELVTRDQGSRDLAPRDDYRRDRNFDQGGGGYRGPIASTTSGYENAPQAEREAAFNKLLKRVGVQQDWTWEQAIKAAVQDPAFRAIKDPSERKDAFDDYKADLKRQEAEREQERIAKLKIDFRAMLQRHPEVQRYSRWKNIRPLVEEEAVFRSTDNDEERRLLFQDYIAELKEEYQEKRFQDHENAMKELGGIMKEVQIGPETRWADAQTMLENSESFRDDKFNTLTRSEVLDTFISHVRNLWDDVNSVKQRNKQLEARQARHAREGFQELLWELHSKDVLLANTTWKSAFPHISTDPRFTALLTNVRTGNPRDDGSTPLELFFDFIDELDRDLRDLALHAESVLKSARIKLRPDLSIADLTSASKHDKRLSPLSQPKLALVHDRIMASITALIEEDAAAERRAERRRHIDDLRQRIKRLEPPVTLDDTWDLVRPRIERLEEYAALPADEDRRAAFDRHIARLQDDADRERRHRRRDKERDRERDRSRDRDRRRSATPQSSEQNAYAEDRRRAIEQRERQYRHASGGSHAGGLSPPPRDRRAPPPREDFGRKGSLDDPPVPLRRGERERRDPRDPREGRYGSRADVYSRDSGLLDYGDEPMTNSDGGRGKRAGDGEVGREVKRVRLEEEEKALQSGSEEGEIEEV